jgi:hypothetical protein
MFGHNKMYQLNFYGPLAITQRCKKFLWISHRKKRREMSSQKLTQENEKKF